MKVHCATTLLFLAAAVCATIHGAGVPFEMTGQIMMIADTAPRRLHLLTRTSNDGYCVWDMSEPQTKCSSGDIVKVLGFRDKPTSAILREQQYPVANYATNITVLSSAELPATIPATVQEIENLQGKTALVHMDGTVVSVVRDATNAAWNWLIVQTDTGAMRAAATEHDYPYAKLRALLDAEVRIRGSVHALDVWRRFLGNHVILYGKGGIEVTKAAGDPFAAPGLDAKTTHRQQISGNVVGASSRRVYIRDKTNQFVSVSPSDIGDMPCAGESVTVAGFVKNGPLGIQLTEAVVRRDGNAKTALEPAEDVDVEQLLAACRDNDIVDASLYGKPVRIRGRVANSTEDIDISGRIMLECSRKNISVDVAHLPQSVRDSIETGSKLETSGICIPEFDADVTNMVFPEFKGLIVIPRSPDDLRVLARPSWWTTGRLLAVIGALVVVLFGVGAWNRALKTVAERTKKELREEVIAHVASDLRVGERTSLAVELHDTIAQNLTGVALEINAANKLIDSDLASAHGHLDTAAKTLNSCRTELKNCLFDLRGNTLGQRDMDSAIRLSVAPVIGNAELTVRFNVPRERITDASAHAIIRIVRELAANAVRHGGAHKVKVAGSADEGVLMFSVTDDGCGFSVEDAPGIAECHFGLQGIRERVARFQGKLDIESAPGKGTHVAVTIRQ